MSLHDLKMRLASVQRLALEKAKIVEFTDDPKLWFYDAYVNSSTKPLVRRLIKANLDKGLIYNVDKSKHILTVKKTQEDAEFDTKLIIEFEHSKKGNLWHTTLKYKSQMTEKTIKGAVPIKNQENFADESFSIIVDLIKEFVKLEPLQD